jgi:hypothetical protein
MTRAAEMLAAGEEAARESLADIRALLAPPVEEHQTWIQRLLHRPATNTAAATDAVGRRDKREMRAAHAREDGKSHTSSR